MNILLKRPFASRRVFQSSRMMYSGTSPQNCCPDSRACSCTSCLQVSHRPWWPPSLVGDRIPCSFQLPPARRNRKRAVHWGIDKHNSLGRFHSQFPHWTIFSMHSSRSTRYFCFCDVSSAFQVFSWKRTERGRNSRRRLTAGRIHGMPVVSPSESSGKISCSSPSWNLCNLEFIRFVKSVHSVGNN